MSTNQTLTQIRIHRGYVGPAGSQVLYREAGAGPVLVMLHPTPESSEYYADVMPLLAAERHVIAFDTPGYGQSDRPDPPFTTIEQYAARIMAGIDELGIGRFAIAGHLTGAVIATEIAAAWPERVEAVILSEPFNWKSSHRRRAHEILHEFYPYDPAGQYLQKIWDRHLGGFENGYTKEQINWHVVNLAVVNAPCEAYAHMGWEGAAPDAMTRYDFWDRAAKVTAPALILYGGKSVLRRALRRALATFPNSIGVIVTGIQSLVEAKIARGTPIDAPEEFATLTLDFLKTPTG